VGVIGPRRKEIVGGWREFHRDVKGKGKVLPVPN
jgi:hypothetical protein